MSARGGKKEGGKKDLRRPQGEAQLGVTGSGSAAVAMVAHLGPLADVRGWGSGWLGGCWQVSKEAHKVEKMRRLILCML